MRMVNRFSDKPQESYRQIRFGILVNAEKTDHLSTPVGAQAERLETSISCANRDFLIPFRWQYSLSSVFVNENNAAGSETPKTQLRSEHKSCLFDEIWYI